MNVIAKKRDTAIDIAKGIAIALVVLGHSGNNSIEKVVSIIHLPIFFFISGLFFDTQLKKSAGDFLKKIFFRLYIPYIGAEIGAIILRNLLFSIGWYSKNVSYGGVKIVPINTWHDMFFLIIKSILLCGREPIIGSIWFIVTLLIMECLYYVINRYVLRIEINRNIFFEVLAVIFCIIGFLSNKYFFVGRITPVFQYWIFFSFGHIFGKKIYKSVKKNMLVIIGIFALISSGEKIVKLIDCYIIDQLIFLIGSICWIIIVMRLSEQIKHRKKIAALLMKWGVNSMHIMIWHFVGFKIFSKMLSVFKVVSKNQVALEAAGSNTFIMASMYFGVCMFFCTLIIDFSKLKKRK